MERLLTCADVARLLNVVPDTVRELERRGRLKAIRTPGGVRLFREAEVQRFAEARKARRAATGATKV
jgi:excisionase family DNA binding protein